MQQYNIQYSYYPLTYSTSLNFEIIHNMLLIKRMRAKVGDN